MAYQKIGEITVPSTSSTFEPRITIDGTSAVTMKVTATDSSTADAINGDTAYFLFDSSNSTWTLSTFPYAATFYIYVEGDVGAADVEGIRFIDDFFTGYLNLTMFAGLTSLYIFGNNIETLDASSLSLSSTVSISDSTLTTLDISGNTSLSSIVTLDVPALTTLDISNCDFSSFDASDYSFLTTLDVSGNPFTAVADLDVPSSLTSLTASDIGLSGTIDVSDWTDVATSLATLDVSNNSVTSFTAPTSNVISTFSIADNTTLTSLDFSEGTSLTSLNIDGTSSLTTVDVSNNSITSFTAPASNVISTFSIADNTTLTSLDFSEGTSLTSVDISGCTSVETLIITGHTGLTALGITDVAGSTTNVDVSGNDLDQTTLDAIGAAIYAAGLAGTSLDVRSQDGGATISTSSVQTYFDIRYDLGWTTVQYDAPAGSVSIEIDSVADFLGMDDYPSYDYTFIDTIDFTGSTYSSNLLKNNITGSLDCDEYSIKNITMEHDSTETTACVFGGGIVTLVDAVFEDCSFSVVGGSATTLSVVAETMPTTCTNLVINDVILQGDSEQPLDIYGVAKSFPVTATALITVNNLDIITDNGGGEFSLVCDDVIGTLISFNSSNCSFSINGDSSDSGKISVLAKTVSKDIAGISIEGLTAQSTSFTDFSGICYQNDANITDVKCHCSYTINGSGMANDVAGLCCYQSVTGSVSDFDVSFTHKEGLNTYGAAAISPLLRSCEFRADTTASLENGMVRAYVDAPNAIIGGLVLSAEYNALVVGTPINKIQADFMLSGIQVSGGISTLLGSSGVTELFKDIRISGNLESKRGSIPYDAAYTIGFINNTNALIKLQNIAVLADITSEENTASLVRYTIEDIEIVLDEANAVVWTSDAPAVNTVSPGTLVPTTPTDELPAFQITEEESKQKRIYEGWDFASTWQMTNGVTVPYLQNWSAITPILQTLSSTSADALLATNNLYTGTITYVYSLDGVDTVTTQTVPAGQISPFYAYVGYTVATAYTADTNRTPNMAMFKARDVEQMGAFVANHLPKGRLWETAYIEGTNMYRIMQVLGATLREVELKFSEFITEFDINTTDTLLPYWEASVKLPNEITKEITDKAKRRQFVKTRFNKRAKRSLSEVQTYMRNATGFDTLTLSTGSVDVSGWNEFFSITVNTAESEFGSDLSEAAKSKAVITALLREVLPAHVAITVAYPERDAVTGVAFSDEKNHSFVITWTDPADATDDPLDYIQLVLIGYETGGEYRRTVNVDAGVETHTFEALQNATEYIVELTAYYESGFISDTVVATDGDTTQTTTTNTLTNDTDTTIQLDITGTGRNSKIYSRLV